MAKEKALKVAAERPGEIVLGADTIVAVGTRLMHKATNDEEQLKVMKLLSGRSHHVLSAVCVVDKTGKAVVRLVSTRIIMKKCLMRKLLLMLPDMNGQAAPAIR